MTLSNTAVPKYYSEFRDAVLRGEIPVCEEIAMHMNNIDEIIADPRYYYDDEAINGFIAFCETEMTLTDGEPLVLLDTFKLWAEDLLSWFYYEELEIYEPSANGHRGRKVKRQVLKRLRNKQFLIVSRGSAKSMYASLVQAYFLTIDTATTKQITTAPTMRQADEVLSPIATAITRARGPVFKFLTHGNLQSSNMANRQMLASTKKGIENFLTGSVLEVRPMSINKLQGLRSKVNTIDEWLSGDIREDVVGAIEQGASKVENWIIIAVSSEGTVRNASGDTIKMELKQILKGEYPNPHVSIFYYKLDSVDEIAFPELWVKASPNIGKTVSYETYTLDVERSEQAPAARNDILAKRFGLPMEGYTYFFSYDETLPQKIKKNAFYGMPCSLGADLSQGDDFCAFTFMFPLGDDAFGIKTRSYISSYTLDTLPLSIRVKYQEFLDEGSLHVFEGTILDMMDVFDDLDDYIEKNQFDVCAFGYDPYNAKAFVDRWTQENGPYGVEKVIQGARTESVPLGELKKLSEQRLLLFDERLMTFAMGNSIVLEDTNGNRKLMKRHQEAKIDNVAAMMDALVAYKRNPDMF